MSDFPRGWTLSQAVGPGTAASITVAAVPGVIHVLDSLLGQLQNFTGANAQSTEIDVIINATTVLRIGISTPAAIGMADESLGSLDLSTTPGFPLTVQFAAVGAVGITEYLTIQGHDL